jgi:hypothetical protein
VLPEVRWTYHDERGVITKIWTANEPRPDTRRHALGHGYTYRLVVHTPHISWPENSVIWNRDLVIRFASSFSGMRVHPRAVAVSSGPDRSELHAQYAPEVIYDGKFVEVIATVAAETWTGSQGDGLAKAKANAEVALGLATRHLGENVIREEVALAESRVTLPARPDETMIDLRVQVPNAVTASDLATLDSQITSLLGASTKRERLETALRWYLHGLISTNTLDRLTAHYIGVEALLRQHAKDKGLVALASKPANDEEYPALLKPLVEKHGQRAVSALIERGKNPEAPDWQCMEAYSALHCWDDEPARIRKQTRKVRNPSLHGGSDTVVERDAIAAQALLELFLDTELDS